MDKLILVVNEYPWSSFFTFLMLYVLLGILAEIVTTIFKVKR